MKPAYQYGERWVAHEIKERGEIIKYLQVKILLGIW